MVYNKDVTWAHPLAKEFASDLNSMIEEDGGKGVFPDDAIAISLDAAEKSKRSGISLKTMDSAIGVSARRSLPQIKDKRMLMCEFRFNCKNWRSISKTELEAKVKNSRSLLQDNYFGKIENKCIFLYDDNIIAQVKRSIARLYSNRTKERIVLTEEEFKNLFF